MNNNLKKMNIFDLNYDMGSNAAIIILKSEEESVVLPLWIGIPEAKSIILGLNNLAGDNTPSRPMSHDLIQDIMFMSGITLEEVAITSIEENTFHAQLTLRTADGLEIVKDCRPSDAIALAVRNNMPILVDEDVYRQTGVQLVIAKTGYSRPGSPTEVKEDKVFNNFIGEVSPEDFAKYAQNKLNIKDIEPEET